MRGLKWQVVAMDTKGFILEHVNYQWDDIDKMLEYIQFKATDGRCARIEIGRWNAKGERE